MSDSKQILKDLQAVLMFAKERFNNEFIWQEFRLNKQFKEEFQSSLVAKRWSVSYYEYTTVITTSAEQYIVVPNQWFALASYFVDFCTEMLTYRSYFEKVRVALGYKGDETRKYATYLRTAPRYEDKILFMQTARRIFRSEFPLFDEAEYDKASSNLWNFVNNYNWWSGSKTVDRHDFFISPILSQMNVVNANSEYLAIITQSFASSLKLRNLTDNLSKFTIDAHTKEYTPSELESSAYLKAEAITEHVAVNDNVTLNKGISISAASLERFHKNF